jgi:TorA maturation chaperone TorD
LVRSDLYRSLAWSFAQPSPELLDALRETLATLASRVADAPDYAAAQAAAQRLAAFHEPAGQRQLDLDDTFGHTISAECPPYETQYGASIIFAQAQRLGDVTAFYRAFGVDIAPDAHERPDHIAAELEFMAVLAFREAIARLEDHAERLATVRDAERKFLVDHLASWALSFAERLERKAIQVRPPDGGFYAAAGRALAALLGDDLRVAEVAPENIGQVEPVAAEFEAEGCGFSCGGSDDPVLVNLPGVTP